MQRDADLSHDLIRKYGDEDSRGDKPNARSVESCIAYGGSSSASLAREDRVLTGTARSAKSEQRDEASRISSTVPSAMVDKVFPLRVLPHAEDDDGFDPDAF